MEPYKFERLIDSEYPNIRMIGWFILGAVDFDRFVERMNEEFEKYNEDKPE